MIRRSISPQFKQMIGISRSCIPPILSHITNHTFPPASIFSRSNSPRILHFNNLSITSIKHFTTITRRKQQSQPNTPQDKSRLTKSHLLLNTKNPISRMLVHIKWPLIRNNRPFSIDDISAFISWMVMGNVLWIILGTTTFGLFTMYSIHTFDNIWNTIKGEGAKHDDEDEDNKENGQKKIDFSKADHSILGFITASILCQGLGINFEFKKGNVLPEWKDGMLRFKDFNVYTINESNHSSIEEGSNDEVMLNSLDFTANIQAMNISLSFKKWYEGNGLIDELEIYGMNAKVHKNLNNNNEILSEKINSKSKQSPFNSMALSFSRYNEHQSLQNDINDHYYDELKSIRQSKQSSFIDSNYELNNIKIHDTYIEVYEHSLVDNKLISPFKITIFNCDLPRLRGNKLLVDFFNANNVTGLINDSMFTIHKRQEYQSMNNSDDNRMVTFKLDGINMGSVSKDNSQLKFNWIVNGKAQIVADIRLPSLDGDEVESNFNISNEYKKFSNVILNIFSELANATLSSSSSSNSNRDLDINNDAGIDDTPLLKSAFAAIFQTFTNNEKNQDHNNSGDSISEYVLVNVKVKFFDLKASLPKQLPMASSTFIPFISLHDLRSLISYINDENSSLVPIVIKTTVIEKLSDLYNAQDLSQTKIFDVIISDIYDDLLKLVKLNEKRIIEEKSSLWSHSIASQLILLGLGVMA